MKKKVALVTGGSRGIGRAIVERLAQEGMMVAFTYRDDIMAASELLEQYPLWAMKTDANDEGSPRDTVSAILERFGQIDVLVNNCGISVQGPFDAVDFQCYEQLIQVNLMSAMRYTYLVIPQMIQSKSGSIVNISSIWGEKGASCESVYSASKAGLESFSKSLAKELGPSSIRVNAISPGVIDTDMNAVYDSEERNILKEAIPLGRFGRPEEIANVVWFLCSDESSFITGENIRVDGGQD
ncbi:glucose 1-dehydrogenase [Clostridia bacterium]|nr:glucose 1-dehydrogenase [Clostridia bacterium]